MNRITNERKTLQQLNGYRDHTFCVMYKHEHFRFCTHYLYINCISKITTATASRCFHNNFKDTQDKRKITFKLTLYMFVRPRHNFEPLQLR